MRFDNVVFNVSGKKEISAREDIPEMYHKFFPENIIKDRISYPYTYDPFLIYFNEKAESESTVTIYSDRLWQWDYDKYNLLCKKHFGNEGQIWENREPEKIQAFLCDWTGKEVILIANIQYVNMLSGYPVWRFDYCDK